MGTHPIFESDFDCLTDAIIVMPSFLGGYARATLKAAVINAENRNRLTEEDKCWREKNERESRKTSKPIQTEEPNTTIERIKSKRHVDKWVKTMITLLKNPLNFLRVTMVFMKII